MWNTSDMCNCNIVVFSRFQVYQCGGFWCFTSLHQLRKWLPRGFENFSQALSELWRLHAVHQVLPWAPDLWRIGLIRISPDSSTTDAPIHPSFEANDQVHWHLSPRLQKHQPLPWSSTRLLKEAEWFHGTFIPASHGPNLSSWLRKKGRVPELPSAQASENEHIVESEQ
jgi:hypothetical protein